MSQTHVYLSTNRYRLTLTDDSEPPVPQNGATVTMTLYIGRAAIEANEVPDVAWPLTIVGSGAGNYDWVPPRDLLQAGQTYFAVSDADLGGVFAHDQVVVRCVADST